MFLNGPNLHQGLIITGARVQVPHPSPPFQGVSKYSLKIQIRVRGHPLIASKIYLFIYFLHVSTYCDVTVFATVNLKRSVSILLFICINTIMPLQSHVLYYQAFAI